VVVVVGGARVIDEVVSPGSCCSKVGGSGDGDRGGVAC
jgi:hypothetical protein